MIPSVHVQLGTKQSILNYLSVVVSTKITRSRDLGTAFLSAFSAYLPQYHIGVTSGKLNLQFIVTVRMDFQTISDFRLYTATIKALWSPPPQVLQLKGVASAIASSNLTFLILFY